MSNEKTIDIGYNEVLKRKSELAKASLAKTEAEGEDIKDEILNIICESIFDSKEIEKIEGLIESLSKNAYLEAENISDLNDELLGQNSLLTSKLVELSGIDKEEPKEDLKNKNK